MDMTTNLKHLQEYELLDAEVLETDGVWADVTSFKRLTVDIVGPTGGAIVKICGSCASSIPANSEHGFQIGNDVENVDFLAEITMKLKYVKCRVTQNVISCSITARAVGESTASGR